MKKTYLSFYLFVLAALFVLSVFSSGNAEVDAKAFVKKMDDNLRGKTSSGISSMEIVTPSWSRTIRMKTWSEGTEKTFIHVLSPAREKDITFLKTGNLLYQYLPSAEMRVKITPSMMMQPWLGSDFTNDDLVKESSVVNDYYHKYLGSEEIGGQICYKIELKPKSEAPVVWGKIILWANKSEYLPVKEEFYDEKGNKMRILTFSDVRMVNDRKFPMRWSMTPLNKSGHRTSFIMETIEFNKPIPAYIFSLKNLEKPR